MGTIEPGASSQRAYAAAQRAYEARRVRDAVAVAALVVLVPLLSWAVSGRTVSHLAIGAGLMFAVGLGAWLGRGWGRGVAVGLLSGTVPLVLAHAARMYGHVCTPSGCTSLCVPACVAGGVIAAALSVAAARRAPWPGVTLATAGGTAVLTGALGCACVGFSGVIGLLAGTGATLLVGRALAWKAPLGT